MKKGKIFITALLVFFTVFLFVQAPAQAFWSPKSGVFTTDRHSNSFLVDRYDEDFKVSNPEENNGSQNPELEEPQDIKDTETNVPEDEGLTYNYDNSFRERYFSRMDRTYYPVTDSNVNNDTPDPVQEEPGQEDQSYQMPPVPAGLTDDEGKVFKMINEFRIENGVAPVTINMKLVDLARKKAIDMVENDYFGHTSPTYGSAKSMVTAAGIQAGLVGENLSKAGNAVTAQIQLEYSTHGHREIMLRPQYEQVGVGIARLKNVPGVVLVEIFIEPK